jgi:hypothetical protein
MARLRKKGVPKSDVELAAVEVWGVRSCSNIMTPAYTSAIICASVIGVSIATVQVTVQRLIVQFLRSPASDHLYFLSGSIPLILRRGLSRHASHHPGTGETARESVYFGRNLVGSGANLRRAPRRAQSAFRALETSFGEMVARDRSPPAPRSCCLILHHTADATEKIAGNMHTDLSSELVQKYCRGPRPRSFLRI